MLVFQNKAKHTINRTANKLSAQLCNKKCKNLAHLKDITPLSKKKKKTC